MALPIRRRQPQSLAWHYHNHHHHDGDANNDEGHSMMAEEPYSPTPIPSREEMLRRYHFRQNVREETLQHRRIQDHGGIADTGRNISFVLRDREVLGARGVILHRRRSSSSQTRASSPPPPTSPRSSSEQAQAPHQSSPTSVHQQEQVETTTSVVRNDFHSFSESNPQATTTTTTTSTSTTNNNNDSSSKQLLRRVSYPMVISEEIRTFSEYCSVVRYQSAFFNHLGGDDEREEGGERPSSSRAVSTISIAFSPDSLSMASTHGDHTVKITCCATGRLLETLEGHPRTPWTVKFHPTDPHILASGCLGHQVRVWNWKEKRCMQMVRLEFAIISLSFHPTGEILAIANGTKLHFWGFSASKLSNNSNQTAAATNPSARETLTEVEQRHMLRCVHFPPDGNTLIIGGVNPQGDDPRRRGRSGMSGQGMSFYLRLWDFDADTALRPFPPEGSVVGVRRRAISNVSILMFSGLESMGENLFFLLLIIT
jgi:activating molecule in BECN1-regulated autophagy protein 1